MSIFSALKDRFSELDLSLFKSKSAEGEQSPSFIGKLNNIFVNGFNGNYSSGLNNGSSNGSALKQIPQNIQLSESDIKSSLQREALRENFAANETLSLSETPTVPNIASENRTFKTNGGEWRKGTTDDTPCFYHTGEDKNGTTLFDEEYYRPDPAQYPKAAAGQWIRLNPNGDARDLPENKGKSQPENISNFDWKGFEWVDAAQVPASYTAEGKTVAFSNHKNAENQLNVFKRYVVDNNLVGTWDEAKFQNIFSGSAGSEIRLELTEAGKTVDGKIIFNVQMSGESLAKLREGLSQYNRETSFETRAGEDGQKQATFMASDTLKVYGNAVRNTAQGLIDAGILVSSATDPRIRAIDSSLIHKKLELPSFEYQSEMYNRDITGKVNKDGITLGKVSEVAVELTAPVAVGKVLAPVKAPQTLDALGRLPISESNQVNGITFLTEELNRTLIILPEHYRIRAIWKNWEYLIMLKEKRKCFKYLKKD